MPSSPSFPLLFYTRCHHFLFGREKGTGEANGTRTSRITKTEDGDDLNWSIHSSSATSFLEGHIEKEKRETKRNDSPQRFPF